MREDALHWQGNWCWHLLSEQETEHWGACLVTHKARGLFYLQGDLGCGKTCLVRGVLRALDYKDAVPSPSYSLVEHYETAHLPVTHFDLYRLSTAQELEHLGFRDYMDGLPSSLCFLEWPENAFDYLPTPDIWLRFKFTSSGRILSAASGSDMGTRILNQMLSDKAIRPGHPLEQ